MQAHWDGGNDGSNSGEREGDASCVQTADTRREGSDVADHCQGRSGPALTWAGTTTGQARRHERWPANSVSDTAQFPPAATTSGIGARGDRTAAEAATAPTPLARPVPFSSPATRCRGESDCATPPSPPRAHSPPYVAAGVLPFCMLGGDLLFLLGQQPRFRSRLKRSSFSETKGVSTSAGSSSGSGSGGRPGRPGSVCGSDDNGSLESASVRRPRRAPRPKLSLPRQPLMPVEVADTKAAKRQGCPHGAEPPAQSGISSLEDKAVPVPVLVSPLMPVPATGVREAADEGSVSPPPPLHSSPGVSLTMGEKRGGAGRHGTLTISSKQSPQLEEEEEEEEEVSRSETDDAPTVCGLASSGAKVDPSKDRSTVRACPSASLPEQQGRSVVEPRGCNKSDTGSVPQVAGATPEVRVRAGLLWSDFGGGREAGDVDAEGTASREFSEESFGMFHGVCLENDSVARSQEKMESSLRDPFLRGKRVFESRNGGYVMFIAAVDFVPDIMMKLARKEIVDGGDGDCESGEGGTVDDTLQWNREGTGSSRGVSEKTDFAWVPASTLLRAMLESRNRSTRKVVLKLGGCRYLRLFHKFVISLWGLDLAAVIKAASAPLHRRNKPYPAPRVLLLKSAGADSNNPGNNAGNIHENQAEGNRKGWSAGKTRGRSVSGMAGDGINGAGVVRCAIRGIDCIRPSVLSGRKRTSLGIVDKRSDRLGPPGPWVNGDGDGSGDGSGDDRSRFNVGGGCDDSVVSAEQGGGEGRTRGKRSGAACRRRRRQCKEARRLKAAAAVAVMPTAAGTAGAAPKNCVALRKASSRVSALSCVDIISILCEGGGAHRFS